MNLDSLVEAIQCIHKELVQQASYAVNASFTLRNWIIGGYINKYELHGSGRAKYGDKLIEKLAKSLDHIPRAQKRELNRYRQFYKIYPRIGESVTPQSRPTNDLIVKLSFTHLDLLIINSGQVNYKYF